MLNVKSKSEHRQLLAVELEAHKAKMKNVPKWRSKYTKLLGEQVEGRANAISRTGMQKSNKRLRAERNNLKSNIWNAKGVVHQQVNEKFIKNIKCHIQCERQLNEEIRRLRMQITNLTRVINRVPKEINELQKKAGSETRFLQYSQKMKNLSAILENQLEVCVHRGCQLTAVNGGLRQELIEELNKRNNFNEQYEKLIVALNSDRKYLSDLIEYAMMQLDLSIEVSEKLQNRKSKVQKDGELQRIDMQNVVRNLASSKHMNSCLFIKGKGRPVSDLTARDISRREKFREIHLKKIQMYREVLDKIYDYTKSTNVKGVIARFSEQESLYYSYFNYANETSYHMTLLNNSVNKLFSEIDGLKQHNRDKLQTQMERIEKLGESFEKKKKSNIELVKQFTTHNDHIQKLLLGFEGIRNHLRTDWSPLNIRLGDYTHIDLGNLRDELKLVESRIFAVLAAVYFGERRATYRKGPIELTVKDVEKHCEWPTELDEIVLTQQCAECAEVEAFNVDDADGVKIEPLELVQKRLCEKVVQPEMQYRLHSISTCRFPRSRMLTARRNQEMH